MPRRRPESCRRTKPSQARGGVEGAHRRHARRVGTAPLRHAGQEVCQRHHPRPSGLGLGGVQGGPAAAAVRAPPPPVETAPAARAPVHEQACVPSASDDRPHFPGAGEEGALGEALRAHLRVDEVDHGRRHRTGRPEGQQAVTGRRGPARQALQASERRVRQHGQAVQAVPFRVEAPRQAPRPRQPCRSPVAVRLRQPEEEAVEAFEVGLGPEAHRQHRRRGPGRRAGRHRVSAW